MPNSPISPIGLTIAVAAALAVATPAAAGPRHRLASSDTRARPGADPRATTPNPAVGGAPQGRRPAPNAGPDAGLDAPGWDTIYSGRGSFARRRGVLNLRPAGPSRVASPVALRPAAPSD